MYPSCTVGEIGNCRTDPRLRCTCVATGTRCYRHCEPPLGFDAPVLIPRGNAASAIAGPRFHTASRGPMRRGRVGARNRHYRGQQLIQVSIFSRSEFLGTANGLSKRLHQARTSTLTKAWGTGPDLNSSVQRRIGGSCKSWR